MLFFVAVFLFLHGQVYDYKVRFSHVIAMKFGLSSVQHAEKHQNLHKTHKPIQWAQLNPMGTTQSNGHNSIQWAQQSNGHKSIQWAQLNPMGTTIQWAQTNPMGTNQSDIQICKCINIFRLNDNIIIYNLYLSFTTISYSFVSNNWGPSIIIFDKIRHPIY